MIQIRKVSLEEEVLGSLEYLCCVLYRQLHGSEFLEDILVVCDVGVTTDFFSFRFEMCC